MNREKTINKQRKRRRFRVRNQLRGTADRPRLSVIRTHKHVYCQIIDDSAGRTLAQASSLDKALRGDLSYGGNVQAAEAVGAAIAERALAAGVKAVRFDRGRFKYQGRVAAVADAARKAGLQF